MEIVIYSPDILENLIPYLAVTKKNTLVTMHKVTIEMSACLPDWLYQILRRLRNKLESPHHHANLLGDRDIEWSWVASQMPQGLGEALDFGCGKGYLALTCARRGYNVTAVDLEPIQLPYVHPRLRFLQQDLLKLDLPRENFDLVIACSTLEHVGLAGRYGVTENRRDGDIEAMIRLKKLLKTGGIILVTIPVGRDIIFAPLHRIYGKNRLPQLFDGYMIEKEEFWIKDGENRWVPCNKETALGSKASSESRNPLKNVYALGLFVLRKPK